MIDHLLSQANAEVARLAGENAEFSYEQLHWFTPEDVIARTHGGKFGGPRKPPGIFDLADTPLETQFAVTLKLRDASGDYAALGTEIEIMGDDGEIQVHFSIVFPKRGSLFAYQIKKPRQTKISGIRAEIASSGRAWSGDVSFSLTGGPRRDFGIVVGGTGQFEGVTGYHKQFSTLTALDLDGVPYARCTESFWLSKNAGRQSMDIAANSLMRETENGSGTLNEVPWALP